MEKFINDYFNDYKSSDGKQNRNILTSSLIITAIFLISAFVSKDDKTIARIFKMYMAMIPLWICHFGMMNHHLVLPKMFRLVPMDEISKKKYLWKIFLTKVIISSLISLVILIVLRILFGYDVVALLFCEIEYIILSLYIAPKNENDKAMTKVYLGWMIQFILSLVTVIHIGMEIIDIQWYIFLIMLLIQIPLAVLNILYIKRRIDMEVKTK